MSETLKDISPYEAEKIAYFGELLILWNDMADKGTLRDYHLRGISNPKTVAKISFSLKDIEDYKNSSKPHIQALFEELDGVIFGEHLVRAADILTGIQRRVDTCRDWATKTSDISFAAYVRLVIGDGNAPMGSVLKMPLDKAVQRYGGPAAYNTTADELLSFQKAAKKYAMNPRVTTEKLANALIGHMGNHGAHQQGRQRQASQASGARPEPIN